MTEPTEPPPATYLRSDDEYETRPVAAGSPAAAPPPVTPSATAAAATTAAASSAQSSLPASGKVVVRGRVEGIDRFRDSANNRSVISFRLERYDEAGNRLAPVAVRFRSMGGVVTSGDEVEVEGTWKNNVINADRIRSLTTGAESKRMSLATLWTEHRGLFILVGAGLTVFVILFVVILSQSFGGSNPPKLPAVDKVSTGSDGKVAVPNLVGEGVEVATEQLSSDGLDAATTIASSSTVPAGSVVSTNPVAGTRVAPHSTVTIMLSSGNLPGFGATSGTPSLTPPSLTKPSLPTLGGGVVSPPSVPALSTSP